MFSSAPVPPLAPASTQNRFGLALVRQVAQAAGSANVFLSPLGVLAALTLAMGGAAGATRAAFATTLFGEGPAADDAEEALARQLWELGQATEGQAVLRIASSLWADHRFSMAPAFVERARALYRAEAATLDFAAPAAAPTINAWAHRQTQGRVSEIVSAKALAGPPPAAVVLLNAVYFQARWEFPFDPAATGPGLFRQADGATQQVPLMRRVSRHFGYLAGNGWQAVALPYEGRPRGTSMLVFVPDEADGLPAFLATLDAPRWATWHAALRARPEPLEVDLTLPRFRLEWGADLVPVLEQLGLAAAFRPGADFAPLGFRAEEGGGFIGAVLHKTFLAVDELGTEAAAVTAVMCLVGAGPPAAAPRRVVVRADSPFFCAIVDDQSGAVLFAGTVCDLA